MSDPVVDAEPRPLGHQPEAPQDSPQTRGRARSRRLASGVATSLVSRGIAAVSPLILIPVTLNYLGSEIYGLWVTVAALTSMVLWADLGLGNGLLTKLGPCHATGDWGTARRYVSSTYALLTLITGLLVAVLWLLNGLIPWAAILNAPTEQLATVARLIALICLSAFLINIPLSMVQRVQYAYQQVAQSNLWQAGGGLLSVALAAVAVHASLAPATVIAAAVSGPIIANVANSAWFYTTRGHRLAPRWNAVDRAIAASILRLGGQFLALSIVTSAALNSDNLIIAHAVGLEAVTNYSVPARLFAALGLVVTLVNLPLWPANGEALARGDYEWVRKMTRRMTALSGLAVVLPAAVLVASGGRVISIWVGGTVHASFWLLIGLASWWFLIAIAGPRFMVQNASGVIGPQLIGWGVFLVVSLPTKWVVAHEFGVGGVAIVGAIGYLLIVWPAARIGYRRVLDAASSRESMPK